MPQARPPPYQNSEERASCGRRWLACFHVVLVDPQDLAGDFLDLGGTVPYRPGCSALAEVESIALRGRRAAKNASPWRR